MNTKNSEALMLTICTFLLIQFFLSVNVTAQTRSAPTIVIDSDDSCRLSMDDTDEGLITSQHAMTVTTVPGQHLLKCIVEGEPSVAWRSVVEAKPSQQIAVLITLKAQHQEYDAAINKANAKANAEKEAAEHERTARDARARASQVQHDEAAKIFERLAGEWKGSKKWKSGDNNFTTSYDYHFGTKVSQCVMHTQQNQSGRTDTIQCNGDWARNEDYFLAIDADLTAACHVGTGFWGSLNNNFKVFFRYAGQNSLESYAFICPNDKYHDEPDCGRGVKPETFFVQLQPDGQLSASANMGSCVGIARDSGVILQKK